MQIGTDTIDQKVEHISRRILDALFLRVVGQLVSYLLKLIRFEEVRNLTARQNVVDVLQETLLGDLLISEQKDSLFVVNTRLLIQFLQIY